eukprot:Tamp_14534.p1 GENE.Tamp_14534~~Tamp_14534.p1  ORF type:complete len:371 (-),score=66.62 Tamp_14534:227-1339(-)
MPRESSRRRQRRGDDASSKASGGGGDESDPAGSKAGGDDESAKSAAEGTATKPSGSDEEAEDGADGAQGGEESGETEEEEEGEEEEEEEAKESVNATKGAGRTAGVKRGAGSDFILPQVDPRDLANENEDVIMTVLGADAADDADELAKSSVYFESGSDRIFVRKRQRGKGDKGSSRVDTHRDRDEDYLKNFLDVVARLIASSFIFCQGLLGGMSLLLLYFYANQTDTELLATYPPIADDTQKAFLFLSSFSLIGALDKYSKDHMAAWGGRGAVQRALDSVIMALYLICFVTTLVCTPVDDVMYASHLRSPEWYKWELGTEFKSHLRSPSAIPTATPAPLPPSFSLLSARADVSSGHCAATARGNCRPPK